MSHILVAEVASIVYTNWAAFPVLPVSAYICWPDKVPHTVGFVSPVFPVKIRVSLQAPVVDGGAADWNVEKSNLTWQISSANRLTV